LNRVGRGVELPLLLVPAKALKSALPEENDSNEIEQPSHAWLWQRPREAVKWPRKTEPKAR